MKTPCQNPACGHVDDDQHPAGHICPQPRVPPIPAGTLCRFGGLVVRAYADIRVGEEWDGRYTVKLDGERKSHGVATREQLEVIR